MKTMKRSILQCFNLSAIISIWKTICCFIFIYVGAYFITI